MITQNEIKLIKNAISVFPDAQIIAITPDRSERFKTGFIDKLKEAGIRGDVWRIFVKESK